VAEDTERGRPALFVDKSTGLFDDAVTVESQAGALADVFGRENGSKILSIMSGGIPVQCRPFFNT
jgi:hypothetical protein